MTTTIHAFITLRGNLRKTRTQARRAMDATVGEIRSRYMRARDADNDHDQSGYSISMTADQAIELEAKLDAINHTENDPTQVGEFDWEFRGDHVGLVIYD